MRTWTKLLELFHTCQWCHKNEKRRRPVMTQSRTLLQCFWWEPRTGVMIRRHDPASWSGVMIRCHDQVSWSGVMIRCHAGRWWRLTLLNSSTSDSSERRGSSSSLKSLSSVVSWWNPTPLRLCDNRLPRLRRRLYRLEPKNGNLPATIKRNVTLSTGLRFYVPRDIK